jgi:hypothetical protein
MTELEQARAHLEKAQNMLHEARHGVQWSNQQKDWVKAPGPITWRKYCEQTVLAALSWVWDAQERDAAWQVWSGASKLAYALRAVISDPETIYVPDTLEMRRAIMEWSDATGTRIEDNAFDFEVINDMLAARYNVPLRPRGDRPCGSPRRSSPRRASRGRRGRRG